MERKSTGRLAALLGLLLLAACGGGDDAASRNGVDSGGSARIAAEAPAAQGSGSPTGGLLASLVVANWPNLAAPGNATPPSSVLAPGSILGANVATNTSAGNTGGQTSTITVSPAVLSSNQPAGSSSTLTIRATVSNPAAYSGTVYAVVQDTQKVTTGRANLALLSSNLFSLTLYTSATLSIGRYQGTLQILLCRDTNCAAQFPASPIALPYDFTVAAAPLVATAISSTTVSAPVGSSSNPAVSVSVRGPSEKWTVSTGANWLQIVSGTGTGAGLFTVQYVTAGLSVGHYTDKVTVRSDSGQQVEIPFTLDITPNQFSFYQNEVSFTAINGAPIPAQTIGFELTNGPSYLPMLANGSVAWTATSGAPWLLVSPPSGITPGRLALQADPSKGNLASGNYTTTLQISSPDVPSKTLSAKLSLAKASLTAQATSITLGGPSGRDWSTQSLSFSLNTDSAKWPWVLSTLPSWISSTTTSGTVNQSGARLDFNPIPAQADGSVSGAATITATVNGDTITLPITLNLNLDQRKLLSSEWGVGFASTPVGNVLSRTIKVLDNYGGAIPWTATSNSSWLSVTPSGTTGNSSALTLTANPAAVPSDTMSYASVTIQTSKPGVTPTVVKVGLWKDTTSTTQTTKLPLNYTRLVADKIRPYVYANTGSTFVDVYNAYTTSKIGTISGVGAAVGNMSVSPDGNRLFVVDAANRSLSVIDLATLTKVESWPVFAPAGSATPVLAIRPNDVEVVVLGDGTAYSAGRTLTTAWGFSFLSSLTATPDGRKVFSQDMSISPSTLYAFDVDFSMRAGGILLVRNLASVSSGFNGQAVAVSPDGNSVYTASGSPYACSVFNSSDLSLIGRLPGGDAYPNNIEVTRDGRVICGVMGWYSTSDFWVHTSNGALLRSYKIAGYAKEMRAGQMVATPDGLVVVAPTTDPVLAFVPIGP